MWLANTGCPSVGLAPITIITSVWSTVSKSCVPADVPSVVISPYPVGEWQTRAQVSMLLLPNAVRTSLATRNVSSFVQRDDEIPPIDPRPYCP